MSEQDLARLGVGVMAWVGTLIISYRLGQEHTKPPTSEREYLLHELDQMSSMYHSCLDKSLGETAATFLPRVQELEQRLSAMEPTIEGEL